MVKRNKLSNFEKLKLCLWKDFCIQWKNRNYVLLAIMLPGIFSLLLLFLRQNIEVKFVPNAFYPPSPLNEGLLHILPYISARRDIINEVLPEFEKCALVPELTIAFAPNNSEAFVEIMNEAIIEIEDLDITSFLSCAELLKQMVNENYFAGVCFHENNSSKMYNNPLYPSYLNYTLIFPSERRVYIGNHIGYHWSTVNPITGVTYDIPLKISQIFNEYLFEGFLNLQNLISLAFIKLATNNTQVPYITMKCFPFYDHFSDQMTHMYTSLPLLTLIAFYHSIIFMTRYRVEESERKIIFLLKALTIKNSLQVCSWLLMHLITMILSSAMFAAIYKINFANGNSATFFFTLFIFLLSYNIANICFCYMISAFLSEAKSVCTISGTIWFLSFLPYFIIRNSNYHRNIYKWLYFLFPNTLLALGFLEILQLENFVKAVGIYYTYHDEEHSSDYMKHFCFMFYITSIIYLIIGIYVDKIHKGELGESKEWKCLIQKQLPIINEKYNNTEESEFDDGINTSIVQLNNVSKIYNGKYVVKNISMTFNLSQLTIIIGRNGCGKSTLMNMICGFTPVSSGSITINGYNLDSQSDLARYGLGFCNVVIEYFTVEEQLAFFAYIRGLNSSEVRKEVEKYLVAIELVDERNKLIKFIGMSKQKLLIISCALIGHSRCVFLKKPTVNMDIIDRTLLIELLKKEKEERAIILITHSPHFGEFFADRIMFMSDGEISMIGSSSYIKNLYGNSRCLICTKGKYCNVNDITKTIAKYIPGAVPESNIGNEVVYRIATNETDVLAEVLKDLETNSDQLDIRSFSVTNTSLEDLFFIRNGLGTSNIEPPSNQELDKFLDLKFPKRLTGFKLLCQQFKAIVYERFALTKFHLTHVVAQLILPLLIIQLPFLISFGDVKMDADPITFKLEKFDETITVVNFSPTLTMDVQRVHSEYVNAITNLGPKHQIEDVSKSFVDDYMFLKRKELKFVDMQKYIIGATFNNDSLIAWFDNSRSNLAPISLNHLHLALLRASVPTDQKNTGIEVNFDPLVHSIPTSYYLHKHPMYIGNLIALFLGFVLIYVEAFFVFYQVEQRISKMQLIQSIAGANLFTLYFSKFCYHLIRIIIVSIGITGAIYFHPIWFSDNFSYVAIFLLIVLWGISAVLMNYMVTSFLNKRITAFEMVTCVNSVGVFVFYAFIELQVDELDEHEYLVAIFRIIPVFSFCIAVAKVYAVAEINSMCSIKDFRILSILVDKCTEKPDCCNPPTIWDSPTGIKQEVYTIIFMSIIYLLIIILSQYTYVVINMVQKKVIKRLEKRSLYMEHQRHHDQNELMPDDEDIVFEKIKVVTAHPSERPPIILEGVGYFHEGIAVLDNLYLFCERGTCTCVLGETNSEKSIICKACVGDNYIDFGRILINTFDIRKDTKKAYKHLGFCSDHCIYLQELTGYELLYVLGLLKGFPQNFVKDYCVELAKVLGFQYQLYEKLHIYNNGSMKRLCWATALILNPSVLILDHITSNVDPPGRRLFWTLMSKLKQRGTTILLSTVFPGESERFTDKVAIIYKGRFICVGHPSTIYSKYLHGYKLKVKIKTLVWKITHIEEVRNIRPTNYHTLMVINFIETEFVNSMLKEDRGNTLIFLIPHEQYDISEIYFKIEKNASQFNIEDFTITNNLFSMAYAEMHEKRRLMSTLIFEPTA